MAQAKRDENRISTMIGVSSIDGLTPTLVYVNPTTGAILTSAGVSNYLSKIDAADSTTTYIGSAVIGSATSSAAWQIKKISVVSTVTTIAWANGSDSFTNIWDNRASLSYS